MIKSVFTLILLTASLHLSAQSEYEVISEAGNPGVKILRGTINKYLIANDSAFTWYASNAKSYQPDTAILKTLSKVKTGKLQLIIFGGTWCEDTQFILPKFFKLQEMSGIPDENITFFGVNRNKKSFGHITEALAINNVPTIIVMKDGKELGRVVEYGKTGKWDKELAEIINQY